jgi:hypothetical protein
LIIVAIYFILSALVLLTPVVMMSISISPVVGSVALYCIAVLMSLTASSTSCFSTVSLNLIFAKASAILIIDSSYLGVAVIVFLEFPRLLILVYSYTNSPTT